MRGWPRPEVALPWGSMSTSSTRRSATASEAARFTAVVVLPTPPSWFATAITLPMAGESGPNTFALVLSTNAGRGGPAPRERRSGEEFDGAAAAGYMDLHVVRFPARRRPP